MTAIQIVHLVLFVGVLSFIGGVHTKDVLNKFNRRK
jgi:hypothetical protein